MYCPSSKSYTKIIISVLTMLCHGQCAVLCLCYGSLTRYNFCWTGCSWQFGRCADSGATSARPDSRDYGFSYCRQFTSRKGPMELLNCLIELSECLFNFRSANNTDKNLTDSAVWTMTPLSLTKWCQHFYNNFKKSLRNIINSLNLKCLLH